MPCFVNLPLRWISARPAWVDWFVDGGIAPELGLDQDSIQLPDSWHESTAARFRDAGLACAVHLPFLGVDPCDPDEAKARAARGAIRRGAELARLYGATHMVGHPYYRPSRAGRETDDVNGPWMERSLRAWPEIPAIGGAMLFLENTYERSPYAVAALIAALGGEEAGVGVCFDVGHWHSFAGCSHEELLDPWLDAFAPFTMHVHLHDNDGSSDQHLGMGKGTIPFDALFSRLHGRGKSVTATLEPHDVAAFAASAAWFGAHAAAAAAVRWEAPRMERLPLAVMEKNLVL